MLDPFVDRHALAPDQAPPEMRIGEAVSRCAGIAGGLLAEAIKAHAQDLSPTQRHLISQKLTAWVKAGDDFAQTWDVIVEPDRPQDTEPF
jgi:hypothetical protein